MPIISARELAQRVIEKIPERIFEDSPNKNWPELREIIAEIGSELEPKMETRLTHAASKNTEWLWDVIWINPETHCLELAAESEMSYNREVVADFKRLLHAKSPIKLLICDRGERQGPLLMETLQAVLCSYHGHVRGEQYLVFDCDGDRRQLHCHEWIAPSDGVVRPDLVRFQQLEGSPIPYQIHNRANS